MSQVYADAAQFEEVFGRLFAAIEDSDPDGMDAVVARRMVVCFEVSRPEAVMWVDGRTKPVRPAFGAADLDADLTARLSGDTLHELLLGTLPLGKALFRRKLKVRGSKSRAMQLESLFHAFQHAYPAIAEEMLGDA